MKYIQGIQKQLDIITKIKKLELKIDNNWDTISDHSLRIKENDKIKKLIHEIKFNFILSKLNNNFKVWDFVSNKNSDYITVQGIKKGNSKNKKYYFVKHDGIKEYKKDYICNFKYDNFSQFVLSQNDYVTNFNDNIKDFIK